MSNIKFTGIMPALITPLDENGKVNVKSIEKLVDWHFDRADITGFYVSGATGEGRSININERKKSIEAATAAIHRRGGHSIVHIGADVAYDALELARFATEVGADAISSLTMGYDKAKAIPYYKAIAANTDKPVLVYATPIYQGDILDLMKTVMEIPNVIGCKFTVPNFYLLESVKKINNGDINVINGPDEMLICGLMMGADGGMGSTYNLMSDWYVDLYKKFKAGDITGALEMQRKINDVIRVLLRHGNTGSLKEVFTREMGVDCGVPAFPTARISDEEYKVFVKELKEAGYWPF